MGTTKKDTTEDYVAAYRSALGHGDKAAGKATVDDVASALESGFHENMLYITLLANTGDPKDFREFARGTVMLIQTLANRVAKLQLKLSQ